MLEFAVNGTLMRGLDLNTNLLKVGATFNREDKTDSQYRIWSIDDVRPAMYRVKQDEVAPVFLDTELGQRTCPRRTGIWLWNGMAGMGPTGGTAGETRGGLAAGQRWTAVIAWGGGPGETFLEKDFLRQSLLLYLLCLTSFFFSHL